MSASPLPSARQRLLELRLQQQAQTEVTPLVARRRGGAPVSVDDRVPLTHTQLRAWFLVQLDPDGSAYNETRAHRFDGPLDLHALEGALRQVMQRHEILRTTFELAGDQPVQRVHDEATLDLSQVDLSLQEAPTVATELQRLQAEFGQTQFDLERGPLMRFCIVHLNTHAHLLLRAWHHIVTDGWSVRVFEHELSALYNAQLSGSTCALQALPIQYADYALWQRRWLSGAVLEQQLAYWRTQLAELPTLQLPTDHARPALQSDRGARLQLALPGALAQRLHALGRTEGATLFMAGLAAFKVLLARYCGSTDIVVGTPIAGRSRTELEPLIGFFANTLVLRTDLSGAPSFREVLARVRECALGAYSHQDLPFERLVEALAPVRDLSRNPLFQVAFAMHAAQPQALQLHGLQVQAIELPVTHSKFDLSLDLSEHGAELHASFEFCTELFDRGTIARLAEHFARLLTACLDHSDVSVHALPLLSPAEQHTLLSQWNDTRSDDALDGTAVEGFKQQAQRTPQATAVLLGERAMSYAELAAQAARLARRLRALGVGADVPVGVSLQRSHELVVAILAVLEAGGVYLPLDPELPDDRLQFMLDDSQAKVLLTQAALRERFVADGRPVISVDEDGAPEPDGGGAAVEQTPSPDALAYLIYTSGSTGTPKGVQLGHRGLTNLMRWMCREIDLTANSRVLHKTSIGFDASLWELLAPLQVGATVVLAEPGDHRDAHAMLRTLREQAITHLMLVPSAAHALLDDEALALSQSLRHIQFGGEALDWELVREYRRRLPHTRLSNFYGPSEATDVATAYEIQAVADGPGVVPIGKPIANVRCHVLDAQRQPAPVGVVGELYIGGVGLARGYLKRAELSAERFVPDPWRPGERLYRSGDLARYRSDGVIIFCGRDDHQIKLRGYRIELGEIEAALANCPGVAHAVVQRRDDRPGSQRLVAYVAGTALQPQTLAAQLALRLPAYMVPAAIVVLPALPLTLNGKVDLRALPAPPADPAVGAGRTAPRDDVERTLCRTWAEVLGIDEVGIDDNFFEIGGHSLLAARLFARLDKAFGRSLALGVLFAAPTVRQLAPHYRDTGIQPGQPSPALVALQPAGRRPPLYFLPGVFGNVVGYVDLVRALGPDQPIFGLQSIGLDGASAPIDSMQGIAQRHVSEIRAHQPHGPYAVTGVCFGATVAYEIARQLLAAGETVAYLGLIAPALREGYGAAAGPSLATRRLKRSAALVTLVRERWHAYVREMKGLGLLGRLRYLARKLATLARNAATPHAFKDAQRELNQLEVYQANARALDTYTRRPLQGRLCALDIIESEERMLHAPSPPIDWGKFWAGTVVQHPVPGRDSGAMLAGGNAKFVAEVLTKQLRAAFDAASGRAP